MVQFSVVIPTYNRKETLPRAIDSVLNQTFEDFEIHIVDTASSDGTKSVVDQYNDSRIEYHRFEERKGPSQARNIGIEHSTGDYISFLDSDDELKMDHLEMVIDVSEREGSDCVGFYTGVEVRNENTIEYMQNADNKYVSHDDLCARNSIGGFSNLTIQRSALIEAGLIDESMDVFEDYELLLRITSLGYKFRGVNEPLTIRHKDTSARLSDDADRIAKGSEQLINRHGNDLSRECISGLYYTKAQYHALDGNMSTARRSYMSSIKYDPSNWLAYPHLLVSTHPSMFRSFINLKRRIKS